MTRPKSSKEILEDYHRKARIPLVWVIYPKARVAKVLHLEGPRVELTEHDELSGEDIIAGFRGLARHPAATRVGQEPDTNPAGRTEPDRPSRRSGFRA